MGQEPDLKEYEFYTYQTNNLQSGFSKLDFELFEIIDSLDLSDDLVITNWVIDSLDYTIIGAVAVDSADNHSEMSMAIFFNNIQWIITPSGFMRLE